MSDNTKILLLLAGVLAYVGIVILAVTLGIRRVTRRSIGKYMSVSPETPPPGAVKVTENAYIIEVRQTAMTVNRLPVMSVKAALFPGDLPSLTMEYARPFMMNELPYLKAGEAVLVSYWRDPGARIIDGKIPDRLVTGLEILGAGTVEWEGDPEVKAAAAALLARVEGSRMLEASGTILETELTGAVLNGNPVYRYRVAFETRDGHRIESDTWQAARPWLERRRSEDPAVTLRYSATGAQDFILDKQ